ncbi:MAG: aspartate--ammonia ligase [Spartobacteria bacterium]|nr:aspartate--ammonia ligase [Spartobacteria bacterium]
MDILTTEMAVLELKRVFEDRLAEQLGLNRVSAPLFVRADSGFQDNLNGTEHPVSFTISQADGGEYQIVHSLAKWKRFALSRYNIEVDRGIYTDMNAIRPDEENLHTAIHSAYVDQWDWEKVISAEHRNLDYLKETVRTIYDTIRYTENKICADFGLRPQLVESIHFVHTEDLLRRFPELSPRERENAVCKEFGAVFIIGIGGPLADGTIHDGRAPDYDDWTTESTAGYHGLNGDIMVWNPQLDRGFELSSMGIRVDAATMTTQLAYRGCPERAEMPWHQMLLNGILPLSIGGGIGQSRLCMLLLQKRHIGEVQVGVWPQDVIDACAAEGIDLL